LLPMATDAKMAPLGPLFGAGEDVQESGVYSVYHSSHRPSHEVTLLKGDRFPECEKCGSVVRFELLHPASDLDDDRDFRRFRVHLYRIPHPESDGE
jgi:hypothetical protein